MSITIQDIQVLRPAALETEGRPYRVKKLEVIDYSPDPRRGASVLVRSGAVGLFVGKKGSKRLEEIRRAAVSKDGADAKLADKIRDEFKGREPMPVEKAVKLLVRQPVFASLRYGGRTLATSVFLPDGVSVAAVAMPYNGGALAKEGFSLVEHYREGTAEELDGVVVRHIPRLSKAEIAALNLLPASMLEMNVGSAALCYALSLVGIAAVVCLATGICCPGFEHPLDLVAFESTPMPDLHLEDEVLKGMSASLAARHLLRLRREMLEHRI